MNNNENNTPSSKTNQKASKDEGSAIEAPNGTRSSVGSKNDTDRKDRSATVQNRHESRVGGATEESSKDETDSPSNNLGLSSDSGNRRSTDLTSKS